MAELNKLCQYLAKSMMTFFPKSYEIYLFKFIFTIILQAFNDTK
jgi:hypothetical protein